MTLFAMKQSKNLFGICSAHYIANNIKFITTLWKLLQRTKDVKIQLLTTAKCKIHLIS